MLKYREPAIELLELFDPLFRAWKKCQRVSDRANANANAKNKKKKQRLFGPLLETRKNRMIKMKIQFMTKREQMTIFFHVIVEPFTIRPMTNFI